MSTALGPLRLPPTPHRQQPYNMSPCIRCHNVAQPCGNRLFRQVLLTGSLPLALHEQFEWRFVDFVMGRRKLRASALAGTRLEQGTTSIIVLVELFFYGRAVWCFIVGNPLISLLSSTLKV